MDIQDISDLDPEPWVDQAIRFGLYIIDHPVLLGLVVLIVVGHFWSKRRKEK